MLKKQLGRGRRAHILKTARKTILSYNKKPMLKNRSRINFDRQEVIHAFRPGESVLGAVVRPTLRLYKLRSLCNVLCLGL